MQDLESLSREELIKKLKLAMEVSTAVDGIWFMSAEEENGFDKALELDIRVWERYPKVLKKRLGKYYELKKEGLEGIREMIELDPMMIPIDFEFTQPDESSLIFKVIKCPALEAMERIGRKNYTCEPVETAFLKNMAKLFDERIQVMALRLPPRKKPNDVCCEWLFTLDEK